MKRHRILPIIFCTFITLFMVLTIVLPKAERSANEKRLLQTFPKFTWENISSGKYMTEFDTYLADHFAFREKWVGAYSYATLALGLNGTTGVYSCDDGYLIATPGEWNETQAKRNIGTLQTFAKKNELDATLIIVPSTGYTMDDILPKHHETYQDDKLFDLASASNLNLLDLRETFKMSDEQLYYKTDHHLTSDGALLMYQEYCDFKGIEPDEFNVSTTVNGFYGTSYSKSGLWKKSPDSIKIYESVKYNDFTVTIDNQDYDSLFFEKQLETEDKYQVFLDGNHAMTRIVNNCAASDSKLLIIKDSFAHCFTTFLASNYNEIYMVDPRYYRGSLKELVSENDIQDVLFLYGADNLASSTDLGWILF
ncbi:MAG: DHHW family protein [Clostridia bacterium]|nr:DHHW family protein [Clostridia bacterium]